MNIENRKNSNNWTQEERDRIIGLFDLLIRMDKKQNPDLYKPKIKAEGRVILDGQGNEVTL